MEDDIKNQPSQLETTAALPFPWLVVGIVTVILLIVVLAGVLFVTLKKTPNTPQSFGVLPNSQDANPISLVTKETATRKIFRGGAAVAIITEYTSRYPDGSLETVVRNGAGQSAPVLSHSIFLRDTTLQLRNGILTKEHLRTPRTKAPLTMGEALLAYVQQTPNLTKQTVTEAGRKLDKYVIDKTSSTSFNIITQAFAADGDATLNVYLDPVAEKIVMAESVETTTGTTQEQIDFADTPAIAASPLAEQPATSPNLTASPFPTDTITSSSDSPLTATSSPTPEQTQVPASAENSPDVEVLQNEATETKIITNDPATNPSDAVLLESLSIIATSKGYSTSLLQYRSKLFVLPSIVRDIEKERGTNTIDISKFTKYVKIRIDGTEIHQEGATPAASVELAGDSTYEHTPTDMPWILYVRPPAGLAPGYHTVDVFLTDKQQWFSLPQLLVIALPDNESAVEITGFISPEEQRQYEQAIAASLGKAIDTPHDYVVLPGEKVRIHIYGKNFQSPLALYLDSTRLDDSMVQVADSSHIILTIPLTFPPPKNRSAYMLTLEQGTQRVVRHQTLQSFCGVLFQPQDHYDPSSCPPSASH